MITAADHEATVAAHIEELKESTSGAVSQTYSFFQLSSRADLANTEVIALVKKLVREQHFAALA